MPVGGIASRGFGAKRSPRGASHSINRGRRLENFLGSAIEDERKHWHKTRARAVADAEAAYERGRQVYADAIRTGRKVVARTPQEVRALGGSVNAGVRSA